MNAHASPAWFAPGEFDPGGTNWEPEEGAKNGAYRVEKEPEKADPDKGKKGEGKDEADRANRDALMESYNP